MKIVIMLIVIILAATAGYFVGRRQVYLKVEEELKYQEKRYAGMNNLYEICSRWLLLKEREINLSDFFVNNNIKTVAVYGMGRIGKAIMENLRADNYDVKYGIDFHSERITADYPVYNIKDDLPEVDMIVVTVSAFESVKKDLSEKTNAKIINIKDILDVILGE